MTIRTSVTVSSNRSDPGTNPGVSTPGQRLPRTPCPSTTSVVVSTQQQAGDRARETSGVLLASLGEQLAVGGDERGGQDPLAEQVLEQVRDPERGLERLGADPGRRGTPR